MGHFFLSGDGHAHPWDHAPMVSFAEARPSPSFLFTWNINEGQKRLSSLRVLKTSNDVSNFRYFFGDCPLCYRRGMEQAHTRTRQSSQSSNGGGMEHGYFTMTSPYFDSDRL